MGSSKSKMTTERATPRVILVTGASSGVGYETSLAFARRGDRAAATARRADKLAALVGQATGLPGEIQPYTADVRSADDMQRVVDDLMARWGRLDVLIANAGLGHRGSLIDANWEDLEVVLRTNIDGVLHSIRAAVPAMRKSGGGHIITISSVVSLAPGAHLTVYSASKAALNTIARTLRVELAPDHIWVTNVLLGQTQTEFAASRRGRPGHGNAKIPSMSAAFVARRIVQESTRRRRTVTLRWFDRLINVAGVFFPVIMDRIVERFYRTR
jgi:3-hydroxy acid dehydrogenase / malonic semialdehyde reductase